MVMKNKLGQLVLVLALVSQVAALYEDQIGKIDWSRQGLGPASDAIFTRTRQRNSRPQVCFASRANVVGCLDATNGKQLWRRVFEADDGLSVFRHSEDRILTVSNNGKTLRLFRASSGTLLWKGNTYARGASQEKQQGIVVEAEFLGTSFVNNGKRSSIGIIVGNSVQMWDGNDNAPGVALWEWTPDTEDLHPLTFALSNSRVCLDKNAECYESGDLLYVFSAVSTDTSTVIVSILASETGEEVDQWTHNNFARDLSASVHVVDGRTVIVKGAHNDLLLLNLDSRNSQKVSVPELKNDILTPGESFSISLLDSSVIRFQSTTSNFEHDFPRELNSPLCPTPFASNFQTFYELDHSKLVLHHIPELKTSKTDSATLVQSLSAVLIVNDEDICHLSAVTTKTSNDISVRMGSTQVGTRLTLPLQTRGRVKLAFFDVFRSKRSANAAGLSYRCVGALLTMEDDSILLVRDGEVVWSLEEALTSIVQTKFINLPLQLAGEKNRLEAKAVARDIKTVTLSERLTAQVGDVSMLFSSFSEFFSKSAKSAFNLDQAFGIHKIAFVLTKAGKLFALHTNSGSIAWSYFLGSSSKCRLLDTEVKDTVQLLCLSANKNDATDVVSLAVATGLEQDRITLDYQVKTILQSRDITPAQYFLVDDQNQVYLYPPQKGGDATFQEKSDKLFYFDVDVAAGVVSGYGLTSVSDLNFQSQLLWSVRFPKDTEKLVKCEGFSSGERVSAPAVILGDDSLLLKYLNPNLITCASEAVSDEKAFVKIMVLDTVSGRIVHQQRHRHGSSPIHLTMFENWIVYSYFRADRASRTELNSIVFYEDAVGKYDLAPWNPLKRDAHISSFEEQLPLVLRQSFAYPRGIRALATTKTRYGITERHLLIATHSNQLVFLDPKFIDPRRPVGAPTAAEKLDRLIQYHAHLPSQERWLLSYNLTLQKIDNIVGVPVNLESTSMVFAYGLDLFSTRLTPSKPFDLLPEEFDRVLIMCLLPALTIAAVVFHNLVDRKRLNAAWA